MGHIWEVTNIQLLLEEITCSWFAGWHISVHYNWWKLRRKGELKWSWKSAESEAKHYVTTTGHEWRQPKW